MEGRKERGAVCSHSQHGGGRFGLILAPLTHEKSQRRQSPVNVYVHVR